MVAYYSQRWCKALEITPVQGAVIMRFYHYTKKQLQAESFITTNFVCTTLGHTVKYQFSPQLPATVDANYNTNKMILH